MSRLGCASADMGICFLAATAALAAALGRCLGFLASVAARSTALSGFLRDSRILLKGVDARDRRVRIEVRSICCVLCFVLTSRFVMMRCRKPRRLLLLMMIYYRYGRSV